MDENALKELATQLACPKGKTGIEVGEKMNAVNGAITQHTIKHLAPQHGESIVEIGFGNGKLSHPIIEAIGLRGNYLGIDHSAEMVRLAKSNLPKNYINTDYICCNATNAELENGSINGLVAINLLYFIDDLSAFFNRIKQWLKPNGRVIFGIRSPEVLSALPVTK